MTSRSVDDHPLEPKRALLTLRLVVLALCGSLVAFAIVAAVVVESAGRIGINAETGNILLATLGMFMIAEVPAYVLVRRSLLAGLRQAPREQTGGGEPTQHEIKTFTTLTVVGAAMVESTGLFGIVTYMVSGSHVALLAPALGLLALGLQLPTRAKLDGLAASTRVV